MNKEEIKAILPVITAFAEGKTIQVLGAYGQKWRDEVDLLFNARPENYRIKPTPKLRPFRRGEIKCGDVVKKKDGEKECLVIATHEQGVTLGNEGWESHSDLLSEFTMADGSPCGKEDEE